MGKKETMGLLVVIIIGLYRCAGYSIRSTNPLPVIQEVSAKEIEISLDPKIKRMLVTAYCPCGKCCGKYADGKTSIGRNARKILGVAADPNVLAYGTKLKIPGVGTREVDDTGGAMRQSTKKGTAEPSTRRSWPLT